MTNYARIDKDGVVRCGCPDRNGFQNCLTRFGEMQAPHPAGNPSGARKVGLVLDSGWQYDGTDLDDQGGIQDGSIFTLNRYNLKRWDLFRSRLELDTWRAKDKRRWETPTRAFITGAHWYWIECPEHGRQIISGEMLADAVRDMIRSSK